jgi:hypothetical protein
MIADPEGPSFITRTVGRRRYADDASVSHGTELATRALQHFPQESKGSALVLVTTALDPTTAVRSCGPPTMQQRRCRRAYKHAFRLRTELDGITLSYGQLPRAADLLAARRWVRSFSCLKRGWRRWPFQFTSPAWRAPAMRICSRRQTSRREVPDGTRLPPKRAQGRQCRRTDEVIE